MSLSKLMITKFIDQNFRHELWMSSMWIVSKIVVYILDLTALLSVPYIYVVYKYWVHSNMQNSNSMCIIDQSHRYGRPQAACREPAGSYDKTTRTAICFEHKTQYLLIHAPYTRIVVFWHISNIPPMISQSQISCDTPTFYIAAIFVKYYYTTGSWLLQPMS